MQIAFAGVVLANPEAYPASGVRLNGEQLYEAVQLVGAARQRVYTRGNELVTVQFSTARVFESLREAERYLLTLWSALPKTGACVFTIGDGVDTEVLTMPGAVLTALPQAGYSGLRVTVQYTVVGGGISTDAAPDYLEKVGDTMLLRDRVAIPAGVMSMSVSFSAPFAAVPVVTATVAKPGGGDNVWATVRADLTTVDGFTVEFSGAVSSSGYYLNWAAMN